MALKTKIDKTTYDSLSDVLKSEYKAVGIGYVLDAEDNDDKLELKTARDKERADRLLEKKRADKLESDLADATSALEEAKNEAEGKKTSEVEKLQKAHDKLVAKMTKENDEKFATVKGQLDSLLIDSVAETTANELFRFTPDIYAKSLITPRLKVGEKDGRPVTIALDKDGKETTIQALREEILANASYADILKPTGSASGGGADHGGTGGKGSGGAETLTQQHLRAAREQGLKVGF